VRRAPPEHGADPAGLRGRNLHLHPATRVGALFDEDVRGWEEVPQAYNVDHFTREGIFIQGQFVPPAMEAPVLPGVGTAHNERMAHYARLGSFGALVSEESAGRVRATRAGFPRVTYQLNAADARKLTRATGLAAEIFSAAGAREVYSGVHSRPVLHGAGVAPGRAAGERGVSRGVRSRERGRRLRFDTQAAVRGRHSHAARSAFVRRSDGAPAPASHAAMTASRGPAS